MKKTSCPYKICSYVTYVYFRSDDAAPNLTDSLFQKIFDKNKFENVQASAVLSKDHIESLQYTNH